MSPAEATSNSEVLFCAINSVIIHHNRLKLYSPFLLHFFLYGTDILIYLLLRDLRILDGIEKAVKALRRL